MDIVGDGCASTWVAESIHIRGLRNVFLLGRHPLEKMPTLFSTADALLVSLKTNEVFSKTIPGKVQAYLASGRSIIAMMNGEGARIVEEARAGMFMCIRRCSRLGTDSESDGQHDKGTARIDGYSRTKVLFEKFLEATSFRSTRTIFSLRHSKEKQLKKLLLTGATGFVGHAVYERLTAENRSLIITGRRALSSTINTQEVLFYRAELAKSTDWTPALKDIDTVIHAAARVHIMNDDAKDPLAEFRVVNVDGTLRLARQAAEVGIRRFIFISSIKVNGEGAQLGHLYAADDEPAPVDPYGISKMEAEQSLRMLAAETGMEVVIIRPVLVYGPGVKANFRSMMCWLNKGVLLPLGAINNKRSLVALDNLVDLIVTCIDHPAAANQIFLVSDGEDLSTTELLRRMAKALGKPARLLPVPSFLLRAGAALIGKNNLAQRLCGSLQVDIEKTRSLLGWHPPMSVDEALKCTAKRFQSSLSN